LALFLLDDVMTSASQLSERTLKYFGGVLAHCKHPVKLAEIYDGIDNEPEPRDCENCSKFDGLYCVIGGC
jgi:hypothetical protein